MTSPNVWKYVYGGFQVRWTCFFIKSYCASLRIQSYVLKNPKKKLIEVKINKVLLLWDSSLSNTYLDTKIVSNKGLEGVHINFSEKFNIAVWPGNNLYEDNQILGSWFLAWKYIRNEHCLKVDFTKNVNLRPRAVVILEA